MTKICKLQYTVVLTGRRRLYQSKTGPSAGLLVCLTACSFILLHSHLLQVFAQRARQEVRYPLLIQRQEYAKRAKRKPQWCLTPQSSTVRVKPFASFLHPLASFLAFFCSFCSWFFLLVGLEISNLISLQIVDFFLCRWYLLIRRGVEELLKYFEARYLLITWATKDTIVDWSLYGVLRLY